MKTNETEITKNAETDPRYSIYAVETDHRAAIEARPNHGGGGSFEIWHASNEPGQDWTDVFEQDYVWGGKFLNALPPEEYADAIAGDFAADDTSDATDKAFNSFVPLDAAAENAIKQYLLDYWRETLKTGAAEYAKQQHEDEKRLLAEGETVTVCVDFENNAEAWWDNGGRDLWKCFANDDNADRIVLPARAADEMKRRAEEITGWDDGPDYAKTALIFQAD